MRSLVCARRCALQGMGIVGRNGRVVDRTPIDLAASRCWTSLALKSGGSAAITALAGTTFSPKALHTEERAE